MSFAGNAFILAQWEINAMHMSLKEENQKDCRGQMLIQTELVQGREQRSKKKPVNERKKKK